MAMCHCPLNNTNTCLLKSGFHPTHTAKASLEPRTTASQSPSGLVVSHLERILLSCPLESLKARYTQELGRCEQPAGQAAPPGWRAGSAPSWSLGSWSWGLSSGPNQQSTQSCILSNKGELVTRAGNSAFQQPLFLFPFKKVSDFIACGKNQRNKLKEAQRVFGADQKHRTFESSWEEREQAYPAFTMCQIQAWERLLCPPMVDSARIKSKFLTTGHQEVRSQSYWTPGSYSIHIE